MVTTGRGPRASSQRGKDKASHAVRPTGFTRSFASGQQRRQWAFGDTVSRRGTSGAIPRHRCQKYSAQGLSWLILACIAGGTFRDPFVPA